MESSTLLVIAVGSVLLALGVAALIGYRIADSLDKKHSTQTDRH